MTSKNKAPLQQQVLYTFALILDYQAGAVSIVAKDGLHLLIPLLSDLHQEFRFQGKTDELPCCISILRFLVVGEVG